MINNNYQIDYCVLCHYLAFIFKLLVIILYILKQKYTLNLGQMCKNSIMSAYKQKCLKNKKKHDMKIKNKIGHMLRRDLFCLIDLNVINVASCLLLPSILTDSFVASRQLLPCCSKTKSVEHDFIKV